MSRSKKIKVLRKIDVKAQEKAWVRMARGFKKMFRRPKKFKLSPEAKLRGMGQDIRGKRIEIADLVEVEQ